MAEVIVGKSTITDIARVVAQIAKRQVIACPSIGDAASPVWLIAGEHSRVVGQCADWRHNVGAYAERQGAVAVLGYWDKSRGWLAKVDLDEATADKVVAALGAGHTTLRREEAREAAAHRVAVRDLEIWERDRPAREQVAREHLARVAARKESLRATYEAALGRCRTRTDGQRNRGDVRRVEDAYDSACAGYPEDQAHWQRVLERIAAEGLAPLGPVDAVV